MTDKVMPGDIFKTDEDHYGEQVIQYIAIDDPIKSSEYFNVRVAPKLEYLMMYGGVARLMSKAELLSESFKLIHRRN